MASTDAKPIPQKNVAYRVTFPIFDADGDLVTGATGLDSEVSKDGGAFADCTNEATEIATASGMYYLDLTSTEMNADTVAVIVKTSSSGAKTTPIVMYPEEAGDIRVNVTQFGSTNGTFSSGRPEVNTTHAAGTAWGSGAITAASIASDAITAAKIAADAITAAKVASDVSAEIADAVWDEDATGHQTQGTFGQAIGDPGADTDTIFGLVNTNLNATVSSRASQTSLDTVDDFLDTEIAAIKAKTDQLTFTVANQVDSNALSGGGGLDAAGVRAAVGLASANLDTQLTAIDDLIDTEVAAIKTVVDAIEVDTQDIQSRIPAALTANGNIKADTLRVGGTLQTAGDLSAQIDAVDNFVDTEVSAVKAVTDKLDTALELDGAVYRYTTNALEQGPAGGSGLDAAGVRAAVGLASANLDTQLADIETKVDDVETRLGTPSDLGSGATVAGNLADIEGQTDNLPAIESKIDIIDDFLDTEVAAIKAKTDNLPADPADASDIAASFTTVNSKLDAIDDYVDTEVSAIKTVTDKLDTALELDGAVYRYTTNALEQAPTGGSGLDAAGVRAAVGLASANLDTQLSTIDDFLDTEIAAIKAKTDLIPASPAAVGDLQPAVEAALDESSTELSAVPTTTGSLREMIQFLHSYFRNKKTVTTSTETLMKEDASTTLGSASISDDGTTFTKGEMN